MRLIEILQKGIARKVYLFVERCASIIPDKEYLKIVYYIFQIKKVLLTVLYYLDMAQAH